MSITIELARTIATAQFIADLFADSEYTFETGPMQAWFRPSIVSLAAQTAFFLLHWDRSQCKRKKAVWAARLSCIAVKKGKVGGTHSGKIVCSPCLYKVGGGGGGFEPPRPPLVPLSHKWNHTGFTNWLVSVYFNEHASV